MVTNLFHADTTLISLNHRDSLPEISASGCPCHEASFFRLRHPEEGHVNDRILVDQSGANQFLSFVTEVTAISPGS